MKFCLPHWDKLREAVRARGLWPLVPTSGQQAGAMLADQLEARATSKGNFDPLMACHNMIWQRALEMIGLSLMADNEDGSERCPICFIKAEHDRRGDCRGCAWDDPAAVDAYWIDGPADAARREAVRLGLLASS